MRTSFDASPLPSESSRSAKVSMRASASLPFGMVITVRSRVRIRVERRLPGIEGTTRVLMEAVTAGGAEAKRAFDAMMGMKKIDVAAIEAARRG